MHAPLLSQQSFGATNICSRPSDVTLCSFHSCAWGCARDKPNRARHTTELKGLPAPVSQSASQQSKIEKKRSRRHAAGDIVQPGDTQSSIKRPP